MADWRALYPFESHWLTLPAPAEAGNVGQIRMHYVDQSPVDQSPVDQSPVDQSPVDQTRFAPAEAEETATILCVHGNPTWSFYFREVVKAQRSRARVVAVDHVGCGLSDKPGDSYPYQLSQHIANLVELITQLDLRNIYMLVHDWGGAIGLGAAVRVPERVAGLAILNTAAFPPPYIPLRIAACRVPVLGHWAMRQWNLFARAALKMTLHRLPRLDDKVAAGLIAPYDSWDNRIAIARFVADIPTDPQEATWQLLAEIESKLQLLSNRPCEIVWGMQDWCFRPECLSRLLQHLPEARVTRLEDVGHYVMEEAASEVNQALVRLLERDH